MMQGGILALLWLASDLDQVFAPKQGFITPLAYQFR